VSITGADRAIHIVQYVYIEIVFFIDIYKDEDEDKDKDKKKSKKKSK
jgi:hypothetical protein